MYSTLDINVNYDEEAELWIVSPRTLMDINDPDEQPDETSYKAKYFPKGIIGKTHAIDVANNLAKNAVKNKETKQAVVYLNGSELVFIDDAGVKYTETTNHKETRTMAKRQYNKEFPEPQTWFLVDQHRGSIEPLRNVVKATPSTVIVRTYQLNPVSQTLNHSLCTYYRSEVFPTYTEATEALKNVLQAELSRAQKELEDARERLTIALTAHANAFDLHDRANTTPNPDAIKEPNYWVYLVTKNAQAIAETIQPREGDTLTEDSYRTNKPENSQYFAEELRKHGLTVAE